MKRTIYRLLALLVTVSVFFAACTKEDPDVKLNPKLSTSQLSNITSDGATLTGFVVAAGSGVVEKGIVYNTATKPTIANNKAVYTGETKGATFPVTLTGLNYATKYYACSYATLEDGSTIYGEEFTFTTLPVVPTVNTAAVIDIAGKSASCGGIVWLPVALLFQNKVSAGQQNQIPPLPTVKLKMAIILAHT
jgi:starch-binding outer membrane protein SusE/F